VREATSRGGLPWPLEIVTSSANSRSLPTGTAHPDARHLDAEGFQQPRQVHGVASPSTVGLVAHNHFLNFHPGRCAPPGP